MLSRHNKDPDYELKIVQSLGLARAFEGEIFLVMVNAGGSREEGFMGGSGVWAPLLGRVDGFEGPETGVKVVEVDLSVLEVSRDWTGTARWCIRRQWLMLGCTRHVQDTRGLGRQRAPVEEYIFRGAASRPGNAACYPYSDRSKVPGAARGGISRQTSADGCRDCLLEPLDSYLLI